MDKIVIVEAKRSLITKFGGSFKNLSALEIASLVGKKMLEKFPKDKIDTIYLGNVIQAGNGQNLARQLGFKLSLDNDFMATVVNSVCGSGMQAIIHGYQSLKLNDSYACLVGGVESMSNAPFLLKDSRFNNKIGKREVLDSIQNDGLYDIYNEISMIETAENLANKFNISRTRQDEFAYNSHLKAIKATENKEFDNEVITVDELNFDEQIRFDINLEKLSKLKPLIPDGTVTAGNSSSINDGAALLILMREKDALELNLKPLAIIEDYVYAGIDPNIMGYAPVKAVLKLLEKTKTSLKDYDLIEMTEAFAAQALSVIDGLGIDVNKFNINGGAIALGHPLGASGARIVVSLTHQLNNKKLNKGIATLCIGGGNAIAVSIKRYENRDR